jgi:hypothetical protein
MSQRHPCPRRAVSAGGSSSGLNCVAVGPAADIKSSRLKDIRGLEEVHVQIVCHGCRSSDPVGNRHRGPFQTKLNPVPGGDESGFGGAGSEQVATRVGPLPSTSV